MPKIDTTVRELVDMVKRGQLRLPEMQRRYVWPATRVRDLLDSLYRGYPSGSILVWETEQVTPMRDLAVSQSPNAFMTQKLLLDGQQRVTSLCAVINGESVAVKNRKRPIDILFNLDHPDGPPMDLTEVDDDAPLLTLEPGDDEEEDEDLAVGTDGAENIQKRLRRRAFVVASKQLLSIPTWIRVSDVFGGSKSDWAILKPLGIQPDDDLYEKYVARLQKLRAIKDYPYVMQVLERNLAYEEVAEIFVRVNSLGVKLRGSDLALAQVTARWPSSLRLFEQFAEELEASWFSLDVGLLVRTMVVFATHQSRFKTVQSISVDQMQEAWIMAKDGIQFAVNFLRSNAGIEDHSLLSSPSLIVAVAALGVLRDKQLTSEEERDLRRWVHVANTRAHYSRGSTESFLDQDLATLFRGGGATDLVQLLTQQLGRLHVEPQDFVGRGARSPLFQASYLALKENGAKDWMSGLALSLTHQGKMHYIEYHHIFPKARLSERGFEKAEINEIANMAFIGGKANRKLFTRLPSDYLPEIIASRGETELLAHAIPTDSALWEIDNYRDFLQWRRERLCDDVNLLLGVEANRES